MLFHVVYAGNSVFCCDSLHNLALGAELVKSVIHSQISVIRLQRFIASLTIEAPDLEAVLLYNPG